MQKRPENWVPTIWEESPELVLAGEPATEDRWEIRLGFEPTGDPTFDKKLSDMLKESVWQALQLPEEWRKL